MHDVDLVGTTIRGYITSCVKKLCPFRLITTKISNPKWITNELKELLFDRDSAFLEASNNPENPNLLLTISKKALHKARADHIRSKLDQHYEDPRKFWAKLNSLIKRKAASPIIPLNSDTGDSINLNDTANCINHFFSTIGPKLA